MFLVLARVSQGCLVTVKLHDHTTSGPEEALLHKAIENVLRFASAAHILLKYGDEYRSPGPVMLLVFRTFAYGFVTS